MKIKLSKCELEEISKRVKTDEDAEEIGENDFVYDLYDAVTPMTMEFELCEDGIDVLACDKLEFSEEMNGWYVSEKVDDALLIKRALFENTERIDI